MRYTKPALTLEQQVDDKFLTRGLIVPDRERALRWLRVVGYYRLSAYFLPFRIVVN
jgi:abortive infection bacteriophage resistance protein